MPGSASEKLHAVRKALKQALREALLGVLDETIDLDAFMKIVGEAAAPDSELNAGLGDGEDGSEPKMPDPEMLRVVMQKINDPEAALDESDLEVYAEFLAFVGESVSDAEA